MLCVVRKKHKVKQAEMVLAEHIITRELFDERVQYSFSFPPSSSHSFSVLLGGGIFKSFDMLTESQK